MDILSTACPYCGHPQATKDHLWWSCGIADAQGHRSIDNLEKELGWPVTRDMSQLRRLAITRSEAGGSARWMRRARFGGGSSRLVYFSPGIFCLLGVYTSLYHPLQEPE